MQTAYTAWVIFRHYNNKLAVKVAKRSKTNLKALVQLLLQEERKSL